MPIDDSHIQGTCFPVGLSLTFLAKHTGELVCFANDSWGQYYNNQNYITVKVDAKFAPNDQHYEPYLYY